MRILLAFLMMTLAGCSVTVPLGAGGKYGSVGLTVSYQPPQMGGLPK